MLKGFEHVGMAVGDLDASIAFYCDLLGLRLLLRKRAPDGGAELAFLDAGGGQLELAAPAGGLTAAKDLPAGRAGVRHITFCFDDIDAIYRRLMAAGVTPVEPPRDAHTREMLARTCFVRDPDGVIVELIER
ncbi:MAG: VOC family protein [Alphaproteobacteria bacterium]|nr:VOC family protein [Alphaproteobacteria bacterium]